MGDALDGVTSSLPRLPLRPKVKYSRLFSTPLPLLCDELDDSLRAIATRVSSYGEFWMGKKMVVGKWRLMNAFGWLKMMGY